MIIIQFNIKKHKDYFTYYELMIGKGLNSWGQLNWISLAKINKDFNGEVQYATLVFKGF